VADGRYGFINGIYRDAVEKRYEVRRTVSDAIDNIMLNRVLGIPVFLFAMYITFMLTINIGGCFIDFLTSFSEPSLWMDSANFSKPCIFRHGLSPF
jgi:ferrous iron transport protein B